MFVVVEPSGFQYASYESLASGIETFYACVNVYYV